MGVEREVGRGGVCPHLMSDYPALGVSHGATEKQKKQERYAKGKRLGRNSLPFTANRISILKPNWTFSLLQLLILASCFFRPTQNGLATIAPVNSFVKGTSHSIA